MILLLALLAQQQDTSLVGIAARRGREYAAAHVPAGARPVAAAASHIRIGQALLDSAKFGEAAVHLEAASRVDARNPGLKGDLGYALWNARRYDDAASAFQAASGLQPDNPWYYIGLGASRAGQERWIEASGMLALAAHTDSVVISRAFVAAILDYYDHAGRSTAALDWHRIGTARYPEVAEWWLKLAQELREVDDTANGLAAAQHYLQLRPNEPLGLATYATYLLDMGRGDSAVATARRVAADSSYRNFAATIFFGVGTRAFRARDYARAAAILKEGQPYSTRELAPRFAYYAGYADLQRAVALGNASSDARDCAAAQAADSLATIAEGNLRLGVSVDSANVTNTLTTTIPQVHQGAANLKRAYCPAQPAPRRRP